jgi:hypothetical protein
VNSETTFRVIFGAYRFASTGARVMFLRFITPQRDQFSHQRSGVFQVAYELLGGGNLTLFETERLQSLLRWFEKNLPRPGSLIYEDAFQIAAIPFRDTFQARSQRSGGAKAPP